jgi:hypothetical protein
MLLTASVNPTMKCDSETRIRADHFTHSPAFEAIPPRSGLMAKDVARTANDFPVVKRLAFGKAKLRAAMCSIWGSSSRLWTRTPGHQREGDISSFKAATTASQPRLRKQ